ncbi:MAG: hypothetical protein A2W64_03705 [Candidatus Zambryskibacteria bacterium RIFCSPLOWO2_02_39_10]|nr:MAG: hypothetical protein A2W64_03705 [Candidatus Zambryskibacteria bacterium RIFCSPLOWO2_02_39_10]OHB13624.1 MAG: hypothetical protein A2Y49_02395 [Candidatus Zambryskibacteria bacterium RIFCSPLOWO2_12_39_8]
MAAAMYNQITGTFDAHSAGTYVGSTLEPEGVEIQKYFQTPDFFELMEEKGIYIRNNRTKKLIPKMIEESSIVVSMAEEPFIPDFLSNNKKVILWEVKNPPLATRDVSEKTYNQIKGLMEKLLN